MLFCLSDLAVLQEPVPHPSGYVRIVEVGNDLLVLARGLVVLKLEFLRGSAVLSGLAGAALLGAAVAFARPSSLVLHQHLPTLLLNVLPLLCNVIKDKETDKGQPN